MATSNERLVRRFDDLGGSDTGSVGGKDASLPGDLAEAIRGAYEELCAREDKDELDVAVR